MIKFSKTPINESEFLISVVNHNIVRLYISVHDSFAVTEIKSLENLIDVESDVKIVKTLIESPEVNITGVDVLHYESRCLGHWVSYYINEVNDIHTASKSLQNFDFSSNFSLLDWFENLNDNPLVIECVYSLIDL